MPQTIIVFCMVVIASPSAEQTAELLCVGEYHGEEVPADATGNWWGLIPVGDGYELLEVKVSIETVFDPIVDEEGAKTGKRVSIEDEEPPLVLVRGVEHLQAGRVQTSWHGPTHRFLYPGETVGFREEERRGVRLTAFGKAGEDPEAPGAVRIHEYALTLFSGYDDDHRSQELHRLETVDEDGPPELVWAGDLDGDGQTDLLMNLTHDYNVRVLTLFLSSRAQPGELVGKAAEWVTTGC